jgi:DNA-binding MarR family transcriptional regulator
MSRADAESAIRRMIGSELIGVVVDRYPRHVSLTTRGHALAEQLIAQGGTY